MKKLIALGAAALLLSGVAQAQTQELFVNIHSGNAMAQGAGLVLAGQALEQKASVRVLLCDAAGDMAVAGKQGPKLKPREVTTQQMLQGVIKAGANNLFGWSLRATLDQIDGVCGCFSFDHHDGNIVTRDSASNDHIEYCAL